MSDLEWWQWLIIAALLAIPPALSGVSKLRAAKEMKAKEKEMEETSAPTHQVAPSAEARKNVETSERDSSKAWRGLAPLGIGLALAGLAFWGFSKFKSKQQDEWKQAVREREGPNTTPTQMRIVASESGTRYEIRDPMHNCVSWDPDIRGTGLASVPSFVIRYQTVGSDRIDSVEYRAGENVRLQTVGRPMWLEFAVRGETPLPFIITEAPGSGTTQSSRSAAPAPKAQDHPPQADPIPAPPRDTRRVAGFLLQNKTAPTHVGAVLNETTTGCTTAC